MFRILKLLKNPDIQADLKNLSSLTREVFLKDSLIARTAFDPFNGLSLLSDIDYNKLTLEDKVSLLHSINSQLNPSLPQNIEWIKNQGKAYHDLILRCYEQSSTSLPESGWKFLCDSKPIKFTGGYYGQLWVNHETKQLLVISAGTKFDYHKIRDSDWSNLYGAMHFIKDIINDLLIYANYSPIQFGRGLKPFIEYIIANKFVDYAQYDLGFTGHSLGALMGPAAALYVNAMYPTNFKSLAHSIGFDDPGSKPLVDAVVTYLTKSHVISSEFDLGLTEKLCIIVNNKPNWINTAGEPFGIVYTLNLSYSMPFSIGMSLLPKALRDFFILTEEQLALHAKESFAAESLDTLTYYKQEWPSGLFNAYLRSSTITPVIETIKPIIDRSTLVTSWCSHILSCVKDKAYEVTDTAYKVTTSATSSLIAYTEETIEEWFTDPSISFAGIDILSTDDFGSTDPTPLANTPRGSSATN